MAFCVESKVSQLEPVFPLRRRAEIVTYSRKRKHGYDDPEKSTNRVPQQHFTTACAQESSTPPARSQAHKPARPKARLVQMVIDLGGLQRKSCQDCGMEYVPWDAADTKIHKKFHEDVLKGARVSPEAREKMRVVDTCDKKMKSKNRREKVESSPGLHLHDRDCIAEVGRKDELCLKSLAKRALETAEKELGAVPLAADVLWNPLETTEARNERGGNGNAHLSSKETEPCTQEKKGDRFKFYLYLQSDRVIGLCVVERIFHAYQVQPNSTTTEFSSCISRRRDASPASLGVSRIWVSHEFRRSNIATQLLNTACSKFFYGAPVRQCSVAFSQPTESGIKFAKRWFGRADGWLVYDDEL